MDQLSKESDAFGQSCILPKNMIKKYRELAQTHLDIITLSWKLLSCTHVFSCEIKKNKLRETRKSRVELYLVSMAGTVLVQIRVSPKTVDQKNMKN